LTTASKDSAAKGRLSASPCSKVRLFAVPFLAKSDGFGAKIDSSHGPRSEALSDESRSSSPPAAHFQYVFPAQIDGAGNPVIELRREPIALLRTFELQRMSARIERRIAKVHER
jgi:hypothetical protein